jgi:hypothetical protein
MSRHLTILMLFAAFALPAAAQQRPTGVAIPAMRTSAGASDDAQAILERYAAAWGGGRTVQLDEAVTLGFRVAGSGGGEYHIELSPEGPARVGSGVVDGTVVFETDISFLRRLDRGELNALTAMGQARAGDPIPLVPHFPEGFGWTPESRGFWLPLFFEFWTREWPLVVPFGDGLTREVHGANAAVLYYDRGLRTAWYQVMPGMRVNGGRGEQANPFGTLVVVTRGSVHAKVDGTIRRIREGEALLVPAGTGHEFWAEEDEYGEALVIMFGERA